MKKLDVIHWWKSLINIYDMPLSETMTCPRCGYEIDIWTDEEETTCFICGFKLFRKESVVH